MIGNGYNVYQAQIMSSDFCGGGGSINPTRRQLNNPVRQMIPGKECGQVSQNFFAHSSACP